MNIHVTSELCTAIGSLLVALMSGIALYQYRIRRQRETIRQLLITEINLLLREAEDYCIYLIDPEHEWLTIGKIVNESPVFVNSSKRGLNATLSLLWVLPRSEIQKVLLFYNHLESCEKLIEILFRRIEKQRKSGNKLTAEQVKTHKVRIERITTALKSATQVTNQPIHSLVKLPDEYVLESPKIVKDKMYKT